ncbi:P-loop containing nucleoside triphosphate hydrolase protein, partial [Schizophyllum fasciatum]
DDAQKLLKLVPGSYILPYHEATANHYDTMVQQPAQPARISAPHHEDSTAQVQHLFDALWAKLGNRLDKIEHSIEDIKLAVRSNVVDAPMASPLQTPQQSPGKQVTKDIRASPQSSRSTNSYTQGNARKKRVVQRERTFSDGQQLFQPFGSATPSLQEDEEEDHGDMMDYDDEDHIDPAGHYPDAVQLIRRIYKDPDANWSCIEQRAGLIALIKQQGDVIITLRTGAGKSLIFILAATLEPGITVIMIPLRALLQDWIRRLDSLGIPYEHFSDSRTGSIKGKAKIVLVSVDVAKLPAWISRLKVAVAGGLIVMRIIIEEAHLVLSSSFRHALRNMHEVRFINAQLVLSSATMPPGTIDWYCSQFNLVNPTVVRGFSDRPNIAYHLLSPPSDWAEAISVIKNQIIMGMPSDQPLARYIVYVSDLHVGRRVAASLALDFYHGTNPDDPQFRITEVEQDHMLDCWLKGDKLGIVATNAFGAGIDYSHIVLTIHHHTPRSASDFAQESGRNGRAGQRSVAVILPSTSMPASNASIEVKKYLGYYVMRRIVYDLASLPHSDFQKRCVRYELTMYLNGIGKCCFEVANASLCSLCMENEEDMDNITRQILRRNAYMEPSPQRDSSLPDMVMLLLLQIRVQADALPHVQQLLLSSCMC